MIPLEAEILRLLGSPALLAGVSGFVALILVAILGKMGGRNLIGMALVALALVAALLWGISRWSPDLPLFAMAMIKALIFATLPPCAVWLLVKTRAAHRISGLLTTSRAFVCAALFLLADLAANPLQGIVLSQSTTDTTIHDTYYIVRNQTAHFILAAVFLLFALAHGLIRRAFPSGSLEWAGLVQFWTLFAGSCLARYPQQLLGPPAMPRRYIDYPDHLAVLNLFAATGSALIFASLLMFFALAGYSLFARNRSRERKDP